jgi:hypothetical protein
MSIEMDNPETPLEMADALTNLVEQMYMAHKVGDERRFESAHKRAGEIGFDLVNKLNDLDDAGDESKHE